MSAIITEGRSGLDGVIPVVLILIVLTIIICVGQLIVDKANAALLSCNLAANCSDCCNATWLTVAN